MWSVESNILDSRGFYVFRKSGRTPQGTVSQDFRPQIILLTFYPSWAPSKYANLQYGITLILRRYLKSQLVNSPRCLVYRRVWLLVSMPIVECESLVSCLQYCGVWPCKQACLPQSLTHWCLATADSDSLVSCLPQSLTPWCLAYCGAWFLGVMPTAEPDSFVLSTAESDSL